ncbi:MAG: flippase-like domain-containing protein [Anaerolineae bacterium]|nr:flippase-like domain-containing protein [Anaerolineae bacterium]
MKRWIHILLNILSLALFGLILWWGGPEAWLQILDSRWQDVLIACVLYGFAGMVSAWRLQVAAESLTAGWVAPWRRFFYVNMTARALGLVLPRALSSLGGKSVGLRAFGIPIARSVWIVLVDNLFDILVLGVLTLPSLLLFRDLVSPLGYYLFAGGVMIVLALLLWWGILTRWLLILLTWIHRIPWLSKRIKLDTQTAETILPAPKPALQLQGLTLVLSLAIGLTYFFIARAISISVPLSAILASFAIVQLSLIIAVAPGGLGIFDLGWLGLLHLIGVPEDQALTFVIAQRTYIFVFVLIWAAVSVLLSFTVKDSKEQEI